MFNPALEKCFSVTSQVAEITKPLESLGISGFFYMRIYPDNSFINITSRHEHANNYFNQLFSGSYQPEDLSDQLFTLPSVSLSAHNPDNKVWQDANNLGYGNAISIYDSNTDMQEITCFYSSSDNHTINHFYINQLDFFKKFKFQFVKQADKIIQELEQDKCLLPDFLIKKSRQLKTDKTKSSLTREALDNIIMQDCVDFMPHSLYGSNAKQVILTHQKTDMPIYLPPQRTLCLMHAIKGKSTKKIANDMNLSTNTVDYYLRILRKELGCCSTKQLIATYSEQLKRQRQELA
ncbi:MAG: LuxR C-terminal-related transcriptional regulator [Legionellaceae bacterium]|nr:LuxR C-terminal-related transcriptional regulator [Legionellaceae bacterium]